MNVTPLFVHDDGLGCARGLMTITLVSAWTLILTILILAAPVSVYPDQTDERREYRAMLEDNFLRGK